MWCVKYIVNVYASQKNVHALCGAGEDVMVVVSGSGMRAEDTSTKISQSRQRHYWNMFSEVNVKRKHEEANIGEGKNALPTTTSTKQKTQLVFSL